MHLRSADLQALLGLWGELAEFPAAETDQALRHCLAALARLIGADNAIWIGADRAGGSAPANAMQGWRTRGGCISTRARRATA